MSLMLNLLHTLKDGEMGEGRSLAWNLASGRQGIPLALAFCGSECKTRFEGLIKFPGCCAWSPCGQLLAATSTRDDVTIFINEEGLAIGALTFHGVCQCRYCIPFIAYAYISESIFVCVKDPEFKGEMRKNGVCWSASGSLLATSCGKDNCICIWKINIARIASRPLPLDGPCYKEVKRANCGDCEITCTWNIEPANELELVAYLQAHAGDINCVQWHPKIDILFSCSSDHTVKVWIDLGQDGGNWQCVQTLGQPQNGHNSIVWSLSFNAGGDKMVTSSDDGTLKVWETENIGLNFSIRFANWSHLYTLTGCHDGAIFSVHWSRDGIIATGGADGKIGFFIQNIESQVGRPLYQLLLKEKTHDGKVNSVQWSPRGNRLLASTSADETIKVWSLEPINEEVESRNTEKNEDGIISI